MSDTSITLELPRSFVVPAHLRPARQLSRLEAIAERNVDRALIGGLFACAMAALAIVIAFGIAG